MHRTGQAPVRRNDTGIKAVDERLVSPVTRMYRLLLRDDQSAATPGAFDIIGCQPWPRQVLLCQVGQMRREGDAVGDDGLANANWREQILVLTCHIAPTWPHGLAPARGATTFH